MSGRRRSLGGLRTLALLAAPALPVIAMGALLTEHTHSWTTERATSNAADAATLIADFAISPLLEESDFTSGDIDPQRTLELDATLQPFIGDSITRIKIWDASGRVVYSDDDEGIGETFPISHELEDSLAGEASSEISELDKSENVGDQQFGRLLEVYVPVRVGPDRNIVGAFELYLPYDPIAASIAADTSRIFVMFAATLVLLYVALAYIVMLWARSHRRAESQEHQANHDPLTQLANRRRFQSLLSELEASVPEQPVAVLFIDLDDFKNVNDRHGHPIGDALLVAVAGRLRATLRDEATLARLGGDEFAVLIPRLQHLSQAGDVANRLIGCLEEPFRIDGLTIDVGASIGIDIATADRIDPDMMQRNADAAMYMAKGAGKGRYATFDPTSQRATEPAHSHP